MESRRQGRYPETHSTCWSYASGWRTVPYGIALLGWLCAGSGLLPTAQAEWPAPVLETVFPPGGQAGTTVTVTVQGKSLDGLTGLRFVPGPGETPDFTVEKTGDKQFAVSIPAELPPGLYDLRTVGRYGVSLPRPFYVSRLTEQVETEPNNDSETATHISLDSVVNGKMDAVGDVDVVRFAATAGQRVVIDCWADRIGSQLHGVLELYDAGGRKLASNGGEHGVDPLLDFLVPSDGLYTVRLFDLTFSGGANFFYRLDLDTQPRVEFAFPPVIQRGRSTRITLFGRNLQPEKVLLSSRRETASLRSNVSPDFDKLSVEIDAPAIGLDPSLSRGTPRSLPKQLTADPMVYRHPGSHAPISIGLTDLAVVLDAGENHTPERAQPIEFPCELAGQLAIGSEQDWYAIEAERGEVLWLEAFGERIGSPVDLDLMVFDVTGRNQLLHLTDEVQHQGKPGFPANHLDPAGRWVAPAKGRYLIMVRNLTGGASENVRHMYRVGIRREVPTADVTVQSPQPKQMTALNLPRGGSAVLDLLVERRRGETGPIRIVADNLPNGIECPPVWIGPQAERGPLIVSSSPEAAPLTAALKLSAVTPSGQRLPVREMMLVWPNTRMLEHRVTGETALAVTDANFPLSLSAGMVPVGFDGEVKQQDGDPLVYQGAVIDLLITVDRRHAEPAAVDLSFVGLPDGTENQHVTLPAGESQAWLSLEIPTTLPPGPYTIAVQGTTDVPKAEITPGQTGKTTIDGVTGPISFYVAEARIEVEVDPFAPRKIARGEIIQFKYTARRKRGFIGKIHTELVAPGGIVGIRGRGVTFTNNTESGTIQIIANPNAPLGQQQFLRLDAVGTVEDQPTYRGGRFLELEVTE